MKDRLATFLPGFFLAPFTSQARILRTISYRGVSQKREILSHHNGLASRFPILCFVQLTGVGLLGPIGSKHIIVADGCGTSLKMSTTPNKARDEHHKNTVLITF
jgi:hypothetical protein